ncbi:MAG: hypothetical protein V3U62_07640, partial [Sedimenticolaceae bacterium]
CQLNNVILTHGGVSPMVVLMSRNNKSTRYPAFFQFLSNNTFSYNSRTDGLSAKFPDWRYNP